MQFSGKEDIEASIENVFAAVSEFESFERSAIRRGIEVQRVDSSLPVDAGLAWNTSFNLRGKPRDMLVALVEFTEPSLMRFDSRSKGVNGDCVVELLALSPRRTRLSVDIKLSANTLAARLFLQSLKLARGNLNKRFKMRLADMAKEIERRQSRLT
ncbi:SRPBCC family protein [Tropicibacter sp. Alg240-R139]|uniref:SRPBCC family protein n=1 Tax=Tropicibacter sp. Alg240-R139 TaxID=2305991 RepID=UPI0013DF5D4E|nr:SRPBCC family protein [Tropicibacter sp. Alg240-R139]